MVSNKSMEGHKVKLGKATYDTITDDIKNTDIREHYVYRVTKDADGTQNRLPVGWCVNLADLIEFEKDGGKLVYEDGKPFNDLKLVKKRVGEKGMIEVETFEQEDKQVSKPVVIAGVVCGALAVCGAVIALAVKRHFR